MKTSFVSRSLAPVLFLLFLCTAFGCTSTKTEPPLLGAFNPARDMLLANFDSKPDPDDVLAVAALGTMLADPRFARVNYLAIAGAYGNQEGVFIDAPKLFELAFNTRWKNAHADWDGSLAAARIQAIKTLNAGGDLWIQEAGQSDFSADLLAQIRTQLPSIDTKSRVHLVQHSQWNEQYATPAKLLYVREYADYSKIPDGNAQGNGTPGFKTDDNAEWHALLAHPQLGELWLEAQRLALATNGKGGYDNRSIAVGGFDFSDTVEATWIFGFNQLDTVAQFFAEFMMR